MRPMTTRPWWPTSSPPPATAWPTTSARPRSISSRCCRATPPGRSSSASSAIRIGATGSATSTDRFRQSAPVAVPASAPVSDGRLLLGAWPSEQPEWRSSVLLDDRFFGDLDELVLDRVVMCVGAATSLGHLGLPDPLEARHQLLDPHPGAAKTTIELIDDLRGAFQLIDQAIDVDDPGFELLDDRIELGPGVRVAQSAHVVGPGRF